MEPTFEKLLVRLAKADVNFVLVGGLAVTLQGYVRFTEDVDILIDSSAANVRRFLDSLSDYGDGFARELGVDDFSEEEGALRIVEESEQCQIDVFTLIDGCTWSDVVSDADLFDLRDQQIRYASKRTLIRWKETSNREKDRIDAKALIRLEEDPRAFD